MKILFFGDVYGKIGRQALAKSLPYFRKIYNPDVVIVNVDNATHGRGLNKKHFDYFCDVGVDIFTAGDHTLERAATEELVENSNGRVLRAANLPGKNPGKGYILFNVGKKKLLVISLLGRVFLDDGASDPFAMVDKILKKYENDKIYNIVVDFHAEATSEKVALSWYLDGRVSAVFGTHTHVPTADERILPNGTAAITDVGFCGPVDSVIGVEKEQIINHFLTGNNFKMIIPEKGQARVDGVYLETKKNGRAKTIKRINKFVNIN